MKLKPFNYFKLFFIAYLNGWQIFQFGIIGDTDYEYNKNIVEIRVLIADKDYHTPCLLNNIEKNINGDADSYCSNKIFNIPEKIHPNLITATATYLLIPLYSKLNKDFSFKTNPRSPPSNQSTIA